MCNCDKRRIGAKGVGGGAGTTTTVQGRAAAGAGRTLFEYVGPTALTVFGPATGRRYRFERPGAALVVDPRDHAALHAVPQLRLRAHAPA